MRLTGNDIDAGCSKNRTTENRHIFSMPNSSMAVRDRRPIVSMDITKCESKLRLSCGFCVAVEGPTRSLALFLSTEGIDVQSPLLGPWEGCRPAREIC